MPIVIISRGSMSGGEELAQHVATTLSLPCLGREIVVEAAAKIGVPQDVLRKKLVTSPGLWDRLTFERRMYVTAVQTALAEAAADGNLVYHGHAGHLLLRELPFALRVRLIAPLARRKLAVVERQGLQPAAAERYVRQVDDERARWTRFMYNVDLADPQFYDVVVNLETLSLGAAGQIVLTAVAQPEFAVTAEVRRRLDDFVLACRVRLALATHPASRTLDLRVAATDGAVTLTGEPQSMLLARTSARVEREVRGIVEAVPGVGSVEIREGIV